MLLYLVLVLRLSVAIDMMDCYGIIYWVVFFFYLSSICVCQSLKGVCVWCVVCVVCGES